MRENGILWRVGNYIPFDHLFALPLTNQLHPCCQPFAFDLTNRRHSDDRHRTAKSCRSASVLPASYAKESSHHARYKRGCINTQIVQMDRWLARARSYPFPTVQVGRLGQAQVVLLHIELQPAAGRLVAPVDDRVVQRQPVRQHHAQRVSVLGTLQIVAIHDARAPGTVVAQQYLQFEGRQFHGGGGPGTRP